MQGTIRHTAVSVVRKIALRTVVPSALSVMFASCNGGIFHEPFTVSSGIVELSGGYDTAYIDITPVTWFISSIVPTCDGLDDFEGKINTDNYFEPTSVFFSNFPPIDFSQTYCRTSSYGFMIEKLDGGRIAIESYPNCTGGVFSYDVRLTNEFDTLTVSVTQASMHDYE